MNYYCLIAGLPEIHSEDTKTKNSLIELKNEFLEQLSASDAELMKLIFAKYDNDNLLAYLANKDAQLNPLGNLNSSDWEQLLALLEEVENPSDSRLLPYMKIFHSHYSTNITNNSGISEIDYLAGLYYEYAMQINNKFLSKWFEFNLNINNILTAVACRKHGFELRQLIVGNNEIATTIRASNARDFGLTGIFDQLELTLRIAEENDLLEREKKIDALKWTWLEENTFFNYFSIEKVLAHILKVEMLERWKPLSIENGTQIFRELLVDMKAGVKFETV
jgi:hypothetical protein